MHKLLALGIASGLFFSTTFVLNRLMSLQGGHWLWTASLRYFFMLVLLLVWFFIGGNSRLLGELLRLFYRNLRFWVLAGTIGFGFFYALVSYSATYSPAWVVAATWQTTILATPVVLLGFGKRVPMAAVLFTVLIFAGVVLVNVSQVGAVEPGAILLGALPVLLAAFCYPLGNQLVWEVQNSSHRFLPKITEPQLNRPFAKVLLMTLGSIPFWLLLIVVIRPGVPAAGQVMQTAIVALFSGIIATGLFLYARQRARNSYELSAVDATQASEVIFALIGEMLFLRSDAPTVWGYVGIALTLIGLCLYIRAQAEES